MAETKRDGFLIFSVIITGAVMLFLIITLIPFNIIFTGRVTEPLGKHVQFYFYDDQTNCSLNGYVFVGSKLVGKTHDGYFNLTHENYLNNFNTAQNISLFGELGDCFNSSLYFDKYWENFEIEDYYFQGQSLFNFKTSISPNNPSRRELSGFIQPFKVMDELETINLSRRDILEDLSAINNYLNKRINYSSDWDFHQEVNYWQTPEETLKIGTGDCEEYSTTLLSLFLAYDSSLNCYNIIFSTHVTTFCKIDDYFIYYDQQRTELRKKMNPGYVPRRELEMLEQEYFSHYGLDKEDIPYMAFNEKSFIEFADNNEYLDWQYLLPTKQNYDIFSELDSQLPKEQSYSNENPAELQTVNPGSTTLSLKEFILDNKFIIGAVIFLLILLIVLLTVLIKRWA